MMQMVKFFTCLLCAASCAGSFLDSTSEEGADIGDDLLGYFKKSSRPRGRSMGSSVDVTNIQKLIAADSPKSISECQKIKEKRGTYLKAIMEGFPPSGDTNQRGTFKLFKKYMRFLKALYKSSKKSKVEWLPALLSLREQLNKHNLLYDQRYIFDIGWFLYHEVDDFQAGKTEEAKQLLSFEYNQIPATVMAFANPKLGGLRLCPTKGDFVFQRTNHTPAQKPWFLEMKSGSQANKKEKWITGHIKDPDSYSLQISFPSTGDKTKFYLTCSFANCKEAQKGWGKFEAYQAAGYWVPVLGTNERIALQDSHPRSKFPGGFPYFDGDVKKWSDANKPSYWKICELPKKKKPIFEVEGEAEVEVEKDEGNVIEPEKVIESSGGHQPIIIKVGGDNDLNGLDKSEKIRQRQNGWPKVRYSEDNGPSQWGRQRSWVAAGPRQQRGPFTFRRKYVWPPVREDGYYEW